MKRAEQEDPDVAETRKILRRLEKAGRKKRERAEEDRDGDQDIAWVGPEEKAYEIVEVAGEKNYELDVAVNEEVESGDGGGVGDYDDGVEDGGDQGEGLDPELVKLGRKDEVEYMVNKLGMFEFGSLEEAWSRGGGSSRLPLNALRGLNATNGEGSSCAAG